jgi:hypothetical protein
LSVLENLPHLVTAKRRARSKDALGGTKDSFTVLFTDKACWRQLVSDKEYKEGQRREQQWTHKVYFVEDPEVDEQCVLVVSGDTMRVQSTANPDASLGMGILYRVMCSLDE